jgi:hypothetical protein
MWLLRPLLPLLECVHDINPRAAHSYLYDYGLVARAHAGSIRNGTLAPAEIPLI